MMSKTDQKEAVSAGEFGVRLALKGETGKMVSYIRISNLPYAMKLGLEDVNEICNKEKTVPLSWITNEGSDIGEEFIFYASSAGSGTGRSAGRNRRACKICVQKIGNLLTLFKNTCQKREMCYNNNKTLFCIFLRTKRR